MIQSPHLSVVFLLSLIILLPLASAQQCAANANIPANGVQWEFSGNWVTPASPCSGWHLVSYCGKACQAKHWKEGGHKERCKNKDVNLDKIFQAANKGDSVEMKRLLTGYSTILTVKVKNRTK